MSKQFVIKLIEISEKDLNLKKQLLNSSEPKSIIEIGLKYGCYFTETELFEVMQERQLFFSQSDQLSEEQLEAVVGGKAQKKVYKTPDGDVIKKVKADTYN